MSPALPPCCPAAACPGSPPLAIHVKRPHAACSSPPSTAGKHAFTSALLVDVAAANLQSSVPSSLHTLACLYCSRHGTTQVGVI